MLFPEIAPRPPQGGIHIYKTFSMTRVTRTGRGRDRNARSLGQKGNGSVNPLFQSVPIHQYTTDTKIIL